MLPAAAWAEPAPEYRQRVLALAAALAGPAWMLWQSERIARRCVCFGWSNLVLGVSVQIRRGAGGGIPGQSKQGTNQGDGDRPPVEARTRKPTSQSL